MSEIKILIVDDDPFARSLLSGGLATGGFKVVAAVGTANDAVSAISRENVNIAILDLDLGPGPNGVDLAHILRRKDSKIGLIFLTTYSDPRFLQLKAGDLPVGSRYLTKSSISNLSTLTNLIKQTNIFPLKTSRKVSDAKNKMSDKQLVVMRALAEGKSNDQIAQQLNVSLKAVEGMIHRLHANLGASEFGKENRRVQLVKAYYRFIGKL